MEPDGGGVGCVFCLLVCKEIEGKHLQLKSVKATL